MFCPNCGAAYVSDHEFCKVCGTPSSEFLSTADNKVPSESEIAANFKIVDFNFCIQSGLLVTMLVILYLSTALGYIPNPEDFFRNLAFLGIVAVGLGIVMIEGNFDVSLGAIIALSNLCVGIFYNYYELPLYQACGLALLISMLCGVVTSVFVGLLKVPSVLVTLLQMFGIIAFVTLKSEFFNGYIYLPGYFFEFGQLWVIAVIFAVVFCLGVLLFFTPVGKFLGSVATQKNIVAKISFKPVLLVYLISSFLAGCVGVLVTATYRAYVPTECADYELYALAAVFMGGVNLFRIKRSSFGIMLGIMAGVIFMGLIGVYWGDSFPHHSALYKYRLTVLVIIAGMIIRDVIIRNLNSRKASA